MSADTKGLEDAMEKARASIAAVFDATETLADRLALLLPPGMRVGPYRKVRTGEVEYLEVMETKHSLNWPGGDLDGVGNVRGATVKECEAFLGAAQGLITQAQVSIEAKTAERRALARKALEGVVTNPVEQAITWLKEYQKRTDLDLATACRVFRNDRPNLYFQVLEVVGSWPSSDRYIAALQRTP